MARSEGRRYCDPSVLTYQAERMPEQIRLKVGGVTMQQIAVYEEFSRSIPGFIPVGGVPASSGASDVSTAGSVSDIAASVAGHPGAPFLAKPQLVIRAICLTLGNRKSPNILQAVSGSSSMTFSDVDQQACEHCS